MPTLVFFSSAGCSSCRHLQRILEETSAKHPEWLIYQVDTQQDIALAREFEVFQLPALFLFHRGNFHSEICCEATQAAIAAAVDTALQNPPQEAP